MNNFSKLLNEWTDSKRPEHVSQGEVKDSVMVKQGRKPQKTGTITKVNKAEKTYDISYKIKYGEKDVPFSRIARITKYDKAEDDAFNAEIKKATQAKRKRKK